MKKAKYESPHAFSITSHIFGNNHHICSVFLLFSLFHMKDAGSNHCCHRLWTPFHVFVFPRTTEVLCVRWYWHVSEGTICNLQKKPFAIYRSFLQCSWLSLGLLIQMEISVADLRGILLIGRKAGMFAWWLILVPSFPALASYFWVIPDNIYWKQGQKKGSQSLLPFITMTFALGVTRHRELDVGNSIQALHLLLLCWVHLLKVLAVLILQNQR